MINLAILNPRDIMLIGLMSFVFVILVDHVFLSVITPPSKQ